MNSFQILPAIDMIDGKCVRLTQGSYNDVKVYNNNPLDMAKSFKAAGAKSIHLVDLDGAKAGKPTNHKTIIEIVKELDLFVEIGGGIRSLYDVELYIDAGISRVILGTAAVNNKELLKEVGRKYGDRLAVGIDAKDGMVAIEGWEIKSDLSAIDFAKEVENMGVSTVIYTDISRDGMLIGPNLSAMKEMAKAVDISVIASGGVSKISDVIDLKSTGVYGVIIGKAIYENRINLDELFLL